jgi:hypothetical protein
VHTGCLSAAPQRFITVQTAFALTPASKCRSVFIVICRRRSTKRRSFGFSLILRYRYGGSGGKNRFDGRCRFPGAFQNAVGGEETELAITLELRFVEPLIRGALLRKLFVQAKVIFHVVRFVAGETALAISARSASSNS